MTKRRTIWWTIYNIYGDISPNIMNEVLKNNPHIRDKNILMEGDVIVLPPIPATIKPISKNDVIVVLDNGKDLEAMYNAFRENPDQKNMPPLIFFSFWDKKQGINFAIIIDKCFKNIREAEVAVGKLPTVNVAKAKILSRWGSDTIFFNRRALQR
jgi:hypothetical protein